jgi:hypothetical protein
LLIVFVRQANSRWLRCGRRRKLRAGHLLQRGLQIRDGGLQLRPHFLGHMNVPAIQRRIVRSRPGRGEQAAEDKSKSSTNRHGGSRNRGNRSAEQRPF